MKTKKPLNSLPELPSNSMYRDYKRFTCIKEFIGTIASKKFKFLLNTSYYYYVVQCGYNNKTGGLNKWYVIFDDITGKDVAFEKEIGNNFIDYDKYNAKMLEEVDELFENILKK